MAVGLKVVGTGVGGLDVAFSILLFVGTTQQGTLMAEAGGKGGNRIITPAGEATGHGIDGGCPYQAEDVAGVLVDQAVVTAARLAVSAERQ